jgi:TolB-like protein
MTAVSDRRLTVFLSYSRADQAAAQRLAAALQEVGFDVWWDTLIEGGAAYAKSIEAALEASDAVLVLWSRTATASDWVLDEAARARDLGKLVPLALDGTEAPLGFRQYQSINLRDWHGGAGEPAIAAIQRAVTAAATRTTSPRGGTLPAASVAPSRSRRALLVGGLGIATCSAAALLWWRRQGSPPAPGVGINSVAVLPFDNLSGDPAQAYFSDGLTEEVRATLARNHALQVMAQASTSRFRDAAADARAIARDLGVAWLLQGTVRRAGDVVRVIAALVDGASGVTTWSDIFERRLDDIFAVQSGIAEAVAAALSAAVAAPQVAATPRESGGTKQPDAFDAYLRGRALYDLSADEASERAALARFDEAIAIDPDYAAAHAARARSLTAIANQYGKLGETAAMYDAAIAAARRAIALAPGLADAHSTLGFTLFQGKLDARAAREPFERSAELGAGEATVLARHAQFEARCGRDAQAVSAMRAALQRDPLNPLVHRASASIEYAARRWAASLPALDRALSMNPRMSRAQGMRGDALLQLGRLDEARAAYATEPVADFRLTGLALVAQRTGDAVDADARLTELVAAEGDRVLYQQAQVLAARGETTRALDALERARTLGDSGLIYARNDPFLDPLRDEPRMQALLSGIGFD